MLDSIVQTLLDPAAADKGLAEGCPAVSDIFHNARVRVSDHGFHLVHVVIESERRSVLLRETRVGIVVYEVVDALFAHGYSPLIST
ncbi:hypothetical protein [Streptomyces poonensis]|uniref:hypothetical protein n=1 Tax=Streptomyces poonensis TaxID=68255 RepID=UPI001E5D11E6|nr:hypothetical protein [Streptomyces poonensis]